MDIKQTHLKRFKLSSLPTRGHHRLRLSTARENPRESDQHWAFAPIARHVFYAPLTLLERFFIFSLD